MNFRSFFSPNHRRFVHTSSSTVKIVEGVKWDQLPSTVKIVEVGPRDGLQNESVLTTDLKIDLIKRLADCGLRNIEPTAFVSPKWVPQMADHAQVLSSVLANIPGPNYPVLVPNEKGYLNAVSCGAREVAVLSSASEAFAQKNIACSVAESFARFEPIFKRAQADGVAVRGYVSTVLGCPYEGTVCPEKVSDVAQRLLEAGCYEISLGDTTGVGNPRTTDRLIRTLIESGIPPSSLAVHFHDTYGMAVANILVALQRGIAVVDSSVGGLGGCPYAKGATGNVATEDVLYMLQGCGIETGVNLDKVAKIGCDISRELGRPSRSKVGLALAGKRDHP